MASVMIMFIIRSKHFLQKVASVAIACSALPMDHRTTNSFENMACSEAEPMPFYFHCPRMCMVVSFRENTSVAILAANSKLPFWAAWTVMRAQTVGLSSVRSNS